MFLIQEDEMKTDVHSHPLRFRAAARVPGVVGEHHAPFQLAPADAGHQRPMASPSPWKRTSPTTVAVLVTHNRPELLGEALTALSAQTRAPTRLVVVDNGSDEATQETLANREGIHVVRSETNLGGAGGFALGIRGALALGADWIWLMDDDAIPEPRALETLQAKLPELPGRVGAVCSAVVEFGAIATHHRRSFNSMVGLERP